jgi:hypothetical protein
METKTHWRKGDKSDYLMSWDLENDLPATIVKVVRIKTKIRGKTEDCRVAYFKEDLKPMVINVTNGSVIEKALGTHIIEEWANINLPVIIYVLAGVKFGRDTVRGLRIRTPDTKPLLTKDRAAAYNNAILHIKSGGSWADIEKRFIVEQEVKDQIESDANT